MPKKKSPYVKGSPLDIVWRLHNKIIPDMEQLLRDKESVNEFNPNFRDCPLDTGAERMHIRAAKACADQIERDGFVDQNLWNKYSEAKEVDRMYLARPDGTTTYGVYNQATGEYVARSMMHVVALNYAAYLNGTSPEHATLREQNTLMERQLMDIERLKAALREVPRAPAEASEGSDDIPHPEARTYSVRSSGDGLFVIDCEYPDGKGHPIAGEMALYDAERIKLLLAQDESQRPRKCSPSPSLPSVAGEEEPVESDLDDAVRDLYIRVFADAPQQCNGVTLLRQVGDRAARLLAETIELRAQLAKYKRDAEAWEKLERWKSEISYVPKAQQWAAWFYAGDATVCAHGDKPLDAVLALAAQLEQKGEG